MEKGYTSVLPKETLIYNLVYHAKNAKTDDELYRCIKSTIDSFECKEGKKDK